jgi:hypothetical protein
MKYLKLHLKSWIESSEEIVEKIFNKSERIKQPNNDINMPFNNDIIREISDYLDEIENFLLDMKVKPALFNLYPEKKVQEEEVSIDDSFTKSIKTLSSELSSCFSKTHDSLYIEIKRLEKEDDTNRVKLSDNLFNNFHELIFRKMSLLRYQIESYKIGIPHLAKKRKSPNVKLVEKPKTSDIKPDMKKYKDLRDKAEEGKLTKDELDALRKLSFLLKIKPAIEGRRV